VLWSIEDALGKMKCGVLRLLGRRVEGVCGSIYKMSAHCVYSDTESVFKMVANCPIYRDICLLTNLASSTRWGVERCIHRFGESQQIIDKSPGSKFVTYY
jgi:hypothetical protein